MIEGADDNEDGTDTKDVDDEWNINNMTSESPGSMKVEYEWNPDQRNDEEGESTTEIAATSSQQHVFRVVNKLETYYPRRVKRSLMLCGKERENSDHLTKLLETGIAGNGTLLFCDPDGIQCRGILMYRKGNRKPCEQKRKKNREDKARRINLLPLNHGDLVIVVTDLICPMCQHVNRFKGTNHGIFPSTFGTAYTVELSYWWITEMCATTNSFRSVYESSRKLTCTPSYKSRIVSGRLKTLESMHKSSRRHANDTIREFIQCIDLLSESMSGQLYFCKRCEVEMNTTDFSQLGLCPESNRGKRRLSSVLIDAKTVELLKETDGSRDERDKLHARGGPESRIVSNRPMKNALRLFLKMTRSCIAKVRRSEFYNEGCQEMEDYFIVNKQLYFRLGAMRNYAKPKVQRHKRNVIEYIGLVRWFIEPCTCLCRGSKRTLTLNHQNCSESRLKL